MASGSVVNRCQGPFGGDIYLLSSYVVHYRQACLVFALQQNIATKILTHGHDTVFAAVVILDKSDCSSLYHL